MGLHFHVIEDWQNNNPELDFYSLRAIGFFSGQIASDPFRPQGYLLLVSIVNFFINNVFLSAKLISMLSGICFLVIIGNISRVLFNPKIALGCLSLLACSPFLVKASVRTASDMLFWCLLAQAIYLFITYLKRESPTHQGNSLFICGLFLGCALSVRYTAIFGIISISLILMVYEIHVIHGEGSIRSFIQYLKNQLLRLALFPIGIIIGFLPAAIINLVTFGKPYYSENWRNIFYSLIIFLRDSGITISNDLDDLAFNRAKIADIEELTNQYPGVLFHKTIHEFLNFADGVASYFSLPTLIAWCFALLGLAYMIKKSFEVIRHFSQNLPHLLSLSSTLVFLTFTALTFFLYERFVILPVVLILIYFVGLLAFISKKFFWVAICLICMVQLPIKYINLNAFARSHLLSNIKAIEKINQLTQADPTQFRVIGTNLYLSYRSQPIYTNYAPIPLLVNKNQMEYCAGLSQLINNTQPQFVLIGSISPHGYPTPNCEHLFKLGEWSILRFTGEYEDTLVYAKVNQ